MRSSIAGWLVVLSLPLTTYASGQEPRRVDVEEKVEVVIDRAGLRPRLGLEAPGDGALVIDILDKPDEHGPYFVWLDSQGTVARENELDLGVTKGQVATLEVRSARYAWQDRASPRPIRMRVRFVPQPFHGEPNDDPATPQDVPLNQDVSIAFLPRHDVDALRVVAPDDGVISARLLERGGHNMWITWQRNGQTMREGEWDLRVRKGDALTAVLRSGRFAWHDRGSPEPVRLRMEFQPEPFPGEPNDDPAAPQDVPTGAEVAIAFMPRRDVDALRIVAPADGVLFARVTDPGDHAPWIHWVRGKREERSGEWDLRVRKGEAVVAVLRSERFDWRERSSPAAVRLRFDLAPEPGPGEPNDTPDAPQDVALGQEVAIALMPRGDVDVLRVVPAEEGVVRLTVLESGGHQVHAAWRRATEEWTREGELDAPARAGEPLLVRLRSARLDMHQISSGAAVRLRLDLESSLDLHEPNDELDRATLVAAGQEVELTFAPRGDVDVFKLATDQDAVVRLRWGELPPGLTPWVVWRDADGRVLREGHDALWVRGSTTVFVELRSARFDWWERTWTQPVRMRLDVVATNDTFEPNDDPALAKALAIGRAASGELLDSDVDMFRITASRAATLLARLEPAAGEATLIEWVGADGRVVHGERVTLAEPTTTLLRLRAAPGATPRRYRLRVVEVGGDPLASPADYPREPPAWAPPRRTTDLED